MKILWSPTAQDKIRKIAEYIALDNPDAALKLIEKIDGKVQKLKQHPESGRIVPELNEEAVRKIVVQNNYIIYYEIHIDRLEILTDRHARQDFDKQSLVKPDDQE